MADVNNPAMQKIFSRHSRKGAAILAGSLAAASLLGSQGAVAQSVPSRYGADDRIGAINEITPSVVKEASRLVKTGKVYSLAIETKPDPTLFRVYRVMLRPGAPSGTNQSTGVEDLIISSPSIGTSIDGFGHNGRAGVHYNGVKTSEIVGDKGAKVFGTQAIPPIATRGVMLDFVRYGKPEVATGKAAINRQDIDAVAKAEGVTIRRGDVVLLHTGWLQSDANVPQPKSVPGLGKDGARYLASLGVVAAGADTPGLEIFPSEDPAEMIPAHQILLADNGVYVLENIRTEELAADGAYEFMFVLAAPRLPGTVQSTINPVAIR